MAKTPDQKQFYPATFDLAVAEYTPFIQSLIRKMRIPPGDEEDFLQEGIIALYDAYCRYDSRFDNQFLTFARHRIVGAILDARRKNDPLKRHMRQRQNTIAHAIHYLTSTNHQIPTNTEIAAHIGWSVDEVIRHKKMAESIRFISIEERMEDASKEFDIPDLSPSIEEEYARRETIAELKAEILLLPQQEREVLAGIYINHEPTKDIAERNKITASRVSQIHHDGITILRRRVLEKGHFLYA